MGRGKRGAQSAWGSSHPTCSSCSFVLPLCRWSGCTHSHSACSALLTPTLPPLSLCCCHRPSCSSSWTTKPSTAYASPKAQWQPWPPASRRACPTCCHCSSNCSPTFNTVHQSKGVEIISLMFKYIEQNTKKHGKTVTTQTTRPYQVHDTKKVPVTDTKCLCTH